MLCKLSKSWVKQNYFYLVYKVVFFVIVTNEQ